jgi:hypothetical protein
MEERSGEALAVETPIFERGEHWIQIDGDASVALMELDRVLSL